MIKHIFQLAVPLFLIQTGWVKTCKSNQGDALNNSCWSMSAKKGVSLLDCQNLNPNIIYGGLMPEPQSCVATTQRTIRNVPSTTDSSCTLKYIVSSGDSCWAISVKFGILLSELQNLNPTVNCALIMPGQHLCVKKDPSPPSAINPVQPVPTQAVIPGSVFTCTGTHVVVIGDLCWSIAGKVGLSLTDLLNLNPGLNCAFLIPGQQLCVQATQSTQATQATQATQSAPVTQSRCNKLPLSVGYATSWAIWRKCMKVLPEDINASAYTHIHFSFAGIDSNHRLILNNEDDARYLRQLVTHISTRYPRVKVVIAVGGWTFNDPGPTQKRFSTMVSTSVNRQIFINSAITLLEQYKVHGIDIDWEYPAVISRGGHPNDADNLNRLISEMRTAFGKRYSISISIPAAISTNINGFKPAGFVPFVDYIISMTYDMRGTFTFDSNGGQLLAHNNITDVQRSIARSIQLGIPANKLLVGLAFYGRSYTQRDPTCSNPGCPFMNPSISPPVPGPCTGESGFISYGEVSEIISKRQFRINRFDSRSLTNIIAYGQNQWATYDSPETIRRRINYAKQECLGGTAVWAVDLDKSNFELSNAILKYR